MFRKFTFKSAVPENRSLVVSFAILVSIIAVGGYLRLKKTRNSQTAQVVRPVPPAAQTVSSKPENSQIVGTFEKNQTVTTALARFGISTDEVYELVKSTLPVYNLAKVKAGRNFFLKLNGRGGINDFSYPVDDEKYVTVSRKEDQLVPAMKKFDYDVRTEVVSGVIDDSLFMAVADTGEQDRLALDLADIFTWDVDFYTDIQKGDSFRMLVQKEYLDGTFRKYGPILAASITTQKKMLTGFRFADENGSPAYYAPDGKALKKSFLKSPLKFGRITSAFSRARLHPILKIMRPHLGVDYAAPVGTPVVAVGSGVVESAGRGGAGGNVVKLRHTGGYESMYLHLSRIAVRSGARVGQGEVIGYVGATGLATGPHLDFRVISGGKFINPTKVVFPTAEPVSKSAFGKFASLRDHLKNRLDHSNN